MIKTIIFDINGVLFPVQPYIERQGEISRSKFRMIKQMVIDIYKKGKISKEYLRKKIYSGSNKNLSKKELDVIFKSLTLIDKDIFTLIKKLSGDYKIYSIVNEAPKWTDIRVELFNLDKFIQKIFVSSEVWIQKPDKRIYDLFLRETKLNPQECLFIDDRKENIKSAKELGFETIFFETKGKLIKKMKEYKIKKLTLNL